MKSYIEVDKWDIIENGFNPEDNRIYESLMSLGNGRMGLRGNFEEDYSGDTLNGTYIAGVYYPDKTRVGWWKNGYPEYFAKVLNAPNFLGLKVSLNGENLDLNNSIPFDFKRVLSMKEGYLIRSFKIKDSQGRITNIKCTRFLSNADVEVAAISYSVTPLNYSGDVEFSPYINGDISNQDSNYNEKFWTEIDKASNEQECFLAMETKKTKFQVALAIKYSLFVDNIKVSKDEIYINKDKYVGISVKSKLIENKTVTIFKYIGVVSNRYYSDSEIIDKAKQAANRAYNKGFSELLAAHINKWSEIWNNSDIVIEGDDSAQQAIRFNIFQLNQTYTGDDPRLNIGPKGFTGEKYGGSTYWDTEAYCIPFYLSTAPQNISRQLLVYRYKQLEKAKENAAKLGLKGALYPMVTMNGEECHNEWEITFEEIHRNAAISYAIYNYINYTGDEHYLVEYGLEVLVETSRFWASRANYNTYKDKYMILGVTGPNEYENNVNNNWYTNTMAAWNLEYTIKALLIIEKKYPMEYYSLIRKVSVTSTELDKWKDITEKMYYPYVQALGIFEQQDGYMDKEQVLVKDLPKEDTPINQKWSWDRILRSNFIKQADVLQGLYFLNERFDEATIKRNFDFYEARTVHESSLSPCIHCIIASEIGYTDRAYEFYLRTSRLDLDNYNNDTDDGLHITSMAGSWMSIVHGFGGMKVKAGVLNFNPFIPDAWTKYSFRFLFREHLLSITVSSDNITLEHIKGGKFTLRVCDNNYEVETQETIIIKR